MSKRLFRKNLLANSSSQLLGVGFPVLVQYYLVRHLRLEDIGYWNIILSTQALVLLIVGFSQIYLIKILSETADEKMHGKYITNTIAYMYLLLVLPLLIFFVYLSYNYPSLVDFVIISTVSLITTPLAAEYYFQATLKNDYIFYRRLISKSIFLLLLFIFVKDETDFLIFAYIATFTLSLEHLINFYFVRKYVRLNELSFLTIKEIFNNSKKYLAFNCTYNTLPHYSIVIGAHFFNAQTIAVLSILFKLVNLATTFITSSVMVIFPYKLRTKLAGVEGKDKFLMVTIMVACMVIAMLITLQDVIFQMFLNSQTIPYLGLEFSLLCFYVLIHSAYNYIVFNHYFVKNNTLFVTAMNLFIILLFFIVLLSSQYAGYDLLFSVPILLSSMIGLVILFVFKNYDVRGKNGGCEV